MPESMRKPAAIVAGLTLLLAGYGTGVVYGIIPAWLALCLSPFVFIIAIVVFIALGAYTALITKVLSDFITQMKIAFLHRYGIETQAVIIHSELYYGPGLHSGDPCFKGQYAFTDQQGRKHTFEFSGECYDPYDIASSDISLDGHYRSGAERRITYLSWFPSSHHLHRPNIAIPMVRGSSIGLHRLE